MMAEEVKKRDLSIELATGEGNNRLNTDILVGAIDPGAFCDVGSRSRVRLSFLRPGITGILV